MKRWIDLYPTPDMKIIPVLSSAERMEFPESSDLGTKTERVQMFFRNFTGEEMPRKEAQWQPAILPGCRIYDADSASIFSIH